jgi:hypothetical protein
MTQLLALTQSQANGSTSDFDLETPTEEVVQFFFRVGSQGFGRNAVAYFRHSQFCPKLLDDRRQARARRTRDSRKLR